MSRLLRAALVLFGAPALFCYSLQRFTAFAPKTGELVALYLLAVVCFSSTRRALHDGAERRAAAAMGVAVIPKVAGWLPGNLDILVTFLYRFAREEPGLYHLELAKKYGWTYDLYVLNNDVILTFDPLVVKHVLCGSSSINFGKGAFFQEIFREFLGQGIFNSDGVAAQQHRAMARPFFHKERTTDFAVFEHHTTSLFDTFDRLLAGPDNAVHQDGALDLQELFGRFTLDSAISFLMGGNISSLAEVGVAGGPATDFLEAFTTAQFNVNLRSSRSDLWPYFELRESALGKPMNTIDRLVHQLIEYALKKTKEEKGAEGGTLLDHLIEETRDPKVLKDQVLNILLAARDTTMSTLTSAVYYLARNPDILSRLRAEILTLGRDTVPDYESARQLKYLRAFLNEVLRMNPPVPFNVRAAVNADALTVENGTRSLYLPSKSRVVYALYCIQRRTDLWGPDAKTFDPDRWLDERLQSITASPFNYTPFSAGARICIGQQFALNEASFTLIRFLQRYDEITIAFDVQPKASITDGEIRVKSQITLSYHGGCWARLGKVAS